MQHGGDVVIEVTIAEPGQELILVEVIGDLAIGEIVEFLAASHVIDGDDRSLAAVIERLDQIGSDESGSAGDDDVHATLLQAQKTVRLPMFNPKICTATFRWSCMRDESVMARIACIRHRNYHLHSTLK